MRKVKMKVRRMGRVRRRIKVGWYAGVIQKVGTNERGAIPGVWGYDS
jgi:hypothetical protein